MRLMELGDDRPKRAGKAVLEYVREQQTPFRKRTHIVIPDRNDFELIKLRDNWNQFLAIDGSNVYFGGTDENPFLVRLDSRSLPYLFRDGTEGFYRAIVPELMTKLVERFKREYKRQGDIFAFPLPYSWEDLIKSFEICHWCHLNKEEGKFPLFETRHSIMGIAVRLKREYGLFKGEVGTIVEGVVRAPDHTDMVLKGPHAVAQTALLYSPTEAD